MTDRKLFMIYELLMEDKKILLDNIKKIHTTEMEAVRFKRN